VSGVEELKILQKIYDMILYAEEHCLKQFPNYQRFVLASSIRSRMLRLLELCIAANKKYYKKTTQQDIDVALSTLRSMVRLAKDLGYLPFKKYEHWSGMLAEIGRMLGGWMKSTNGNGVRVNV
jgi:hypothetical protein